VLGRGDGRERVHLVVLAEQRPFDTRDLQASAQHVEGVRLAARAQLAGRLLARPEAHHLAPAAHRQHALQRLLACVDDEPAAAGTVRTRWWNWRSMAARSSKMSAWSNSRLFSTAVRGR
jgi:hypothetical protein